MFARFGGRGCHGLLFGEHWIHGLRAVTHRGAVRIRELLVGRCPLRLLPLVLMMLCFLSGPGATLHAVTATMRLQASNPFQGQSWYIDPYSNAQQQIARWRHSRPTDAAEMKKIAGHAQADWFDDWTKPIQLRVDQRVSTIAAAHALPLLVAYNLPHRDCGGYSAGGASSPSAYREWIQSFAQGIKARKAVVVLEPDALALLGCLAPSDRTMRIALIRYAVRVLKAHANIAVYVDAGHSGWIAAREMASRLRSVDIAGANGFALNLSNFMKTADEERYGHEIAAYIGNKHFIIDTSRNGRGPAPNGDYCNPPGRALGTPPTIHTGDPLVDAFVWIKRPGESDGSCNGGPKAGLWWPDYALGLARRATFHNSTASNHTTIVHRSNRCSTASSVTGLEVLKPLTLSKRSLRADDTVVATASLLNCSKNSATIRYIRIVARPVDTRTKGTSVTFTGILSHLHVRARQVLRLKGVHRFTKHDPGGRWYVYVTFQESGKPPRSVQPGAFFAHKNVRIHAALSTATATPVAATSTSVSGPQVTGSLVLSGDSVSAGGTLTATATLQNQGSTSVTLSRVVLAAIPPSGTHEAGPHNNDFGVVTEVTLAPGERRTFPTIPHTFSLDALPGTWHSYLTYETSDGQYYDVAPEAKDLLFTVTAAAPTAAATSTPTATPSATATGTPSATPTTTPSATATTTAIPSATTTATSGIVVTSGFALSADSVSAGGTLTATATLQNQGSTSIMLLRIVLSAVPHGGTHQNGPHDNDFGSLDQVLLAPEQSITITEPHTFPTTAPTGAWDGYLTYETADEQYHDTPPDVPFVVTAAVPTATASPTTMPSATPTTTPSTTATTTAIPSATTTATSGIVAITGTFALSADSVSAGGTLTATATLQNQGSTSVTLSSIALAAVPPGGTHTTGPHDNDFGSVANVTLAPGQSITVVKAHTFPTTAPTGTWDGYLTYETSDTQYHDVPPDVYFTVTPT